MAETYYDISACFKEVLSDALACAAHTNVSANRARSNAEQALERVICQRSRKTFILRTCDRPESPGDMEPVTEYGEAGGITMTGKDDVMLSIYVTARDARKLIRKHKLKKI